MFYRRKVLLGLLEALDRQVPKVDLQKYLFLVCQAQDIPSYHFVPYRFGCYSFQADADKRTLTKYGLVRDQEVWVLNKPKKFLHSLTQADQIAISGVVARFSELRGHDLVRHVYQTNPYFAINSEIRNKILTSREQEKVTAAQPKGGPARLLTIGYEGQSLEQYLNKLIAQAVSVLCDVRRNAVSRKYGFSKRQLQHACDGLGISYVHMPELGIDSHKRKQLRSPGDYDSLFREYVNTTLSDNNGALDSIVELVGGQERVALTCFEADADCCHRSHIASALQSRPGFSHRIAHL